MDLFQGAGFIEFLSPVAGIRTIKIIRYGAGSWNESVFATALRKRSKNDVDYNNDIRRKIMNCRFCIPDHQPLSSMGEDDSYLPRFKCREKSASPVRRAIICDRLASLDLAGNIIDDQCPLALTGNWKACPFYKA